MSLRPPSFAVWKGDRRVTPLPVRLLERNIHTQQVPVRQHQTRTHQRTEKAILAHAIVVVREPCGSLSASQGEFFRVCACEVITIPVVFVFVPSVVQVLGCQRSVSLIMFLIPVGHDGYVEQEHKVIVPSKEKFTTILEKLLSPMERLSGSGECAKRPMCGPTE